MPENSGNQDFEELYDSIKIEDSAYELGLELMKKHHWVVGVACREWEIEVHVSKRLSSQEESALPRMMDGYRVVYLYVVDQEIELQ